MATVKMTVNLIDQILENFENSFESERAQLPKYKPKWPDGIGDELYSLILPPEKEEAIVKLYPEWWKVQTVNQLTAYYAGTGGQAKFTKSRMSIPQTPLLKPPGFKHVRFDGFYLDFAIDDIEQVELPKFKEFIKECDKVQTVHKEFQERVNADAESLRVFLEKHRTLQKAIDEFGPALMTWVPQYQQDIYNKPVEPKQKKDVPKEEEIIVDLDALRTRAINSSLGLNGEATFQDSADGFVASPAKRAQRRVKSAMLPPSAYASNTVTLNPAPYKFTV